MAERSTSSAITQAHAVKFKSSPDHAEIDYVTFVHHLIGAKQIYGVYDNGEECKVYLKEKEYVTEIIKTGQLFNGQQIPEYNLAPGVKVILSNVDPIIPNSDILKKLQAFGTDVSPIVRHKILTRYHFSHIQTSTRHLYMNLQRTLPEKITVEFKNKRYEIDISIGQEGSASPMTGELSSEERRALLEASFDNLTPFAQMIARTLLP